MSAIASASSVPGVCACDTVMTAVPYRFDLHEIPKELSIIKGVSPVLSGLSEPLLTGGLTDFEEAIIDWDGKSIPHPRADLNEAEQLMYLKAIKQGTLPYMTLHNLRLVIQKAPILDIGPRSPHFCIFCGVLSSRRDELLFHCQRYHTGFVTACEEHRTYFMDKRSAATHLRRVHKVRKITSRYFCQFSRPPFNLDLVKAGVKFKEFGGGANIFNVLSRILRTVPAHTNGRSSEPQASTSTASSETTDEISQTGNKLTDYLKPINSIINSL